MPRKILPFIIGGGLLVVFILFSYLVHRDVFTQIDFNTTVRLQDNISRSWDREFSWLSEIGSFEISLVFLIGISLFARKLIAGFIALGLFAGFHLIELFGKIYVNHLPPPQFMLRTQHLLDFPQFHVRSEYSYPSGHAGRGVFISVILIMLIWHSRISLLLKSVFCLAIVAYNAVMLVSRVYLGEHWMTDVIGGALLGGALGMICGGVMGWKIDKKFNTLTKK